MHLGVGALEIRAGIERRASVAGPGDVDDVGVVFFNEAVQMNVDQVLPGRGSPVAQQARLDLRGSQPFAQQRILKEVDLADAQIVGRAPVAMHFVEQLGR